MMLDRTFGVCNKKMLLFIIMGIDEKHHGIPLAFLLFFTPSVNKANIIWIQHCNLGTLAEPMVQRPQVIQQETICGSVVVTDTDLKKQAVLMQVFPDVWLLLYKFHV